MTVSRRGRAGLWLAAGGVLTLSIVAGLALGGWGLIMAGVVPAVLMGLAMLVEPLLGLLGVAAMVPTERLIYFESVGTAVKLMAGFVATVWILLKLRKGESFAALLRDRVLIAALLLLTYTFVSVLWRQVPLTGGIGQFARQLLLLGLFVLAMDLVRSWRDAEWLVRALVVGSTVAAAITVQQFFDGSVRRAGAAATGGINATAVVLVTTIPLAFYLVRSRQSLLWRALGLVYIGLGMLGIVLTFSRMSFLLLPLLVLAEGWDAFRTRRGRSALIGLAVIAFVLAVRFVPVDRVAERLESIGPYVEATLHGGTGRTAATSERGYHIRIALAIFRDHPVFGAGFDAYGPLFLEYQQRVPGNPLWYRTFRSAHGTVWEVLANLGLVGLVLLGVLVWNAWQRIRRARRNLSLFGSGSNRALMVRAIGMALLVVLAYTLYANVHMEKMPWLLVGLASAVFALSERDRRVAQRRGSEDVAGLRPRRPAPSLLGA